MNAIQLKMARTALDLTVRQAAELAGCSHETIVAIEAGRPSVKQSTVDKVRTALEATGVVFIPENGGGVGVRLRKTAAKSDRPAGIPIENLTAENDE